jgi:hypothetical protein
MILLVKTTLAARERISHRFVMFQDLTKIDVLLQGRKYHAGGTIPLNRNSRKRAKATEKGDNDGGDEEE